MKCTAGMLSAVLWLAATALAYGQANAALHTADTFLDFEVGTSAPRVVSIRAGKHEAWSNRGSEALIDHVTINGEKVPLQWRYNSAASHADANGIAWIYDSSDPKLQLTWEWDVRAGTGPIEHSIRIENLGSKEVWLPLQDSFQFNFQIDPKISLEHFFVEKGAGSPSAIGTHQVTVPAGYKWIGTSSTYAHPKENEPREVIPYFSVQRADQTGWYVGIEFSGRTQVSVERKDQSLHGSAGLNPHPAPFGTRLQPGERFETPTVFVGAFAGGPDGAANVLRPWVRQVLGNAKAWENPHYPVMVNNSWGSGMQVDEEMALRMIRESAELGLEMFHIDAGWFRGVGDWYPHPQKFPNGLAPIADAAHKSGLKFGIWVDWTQAALDTEPGALNARDPKVRTWMVTDLPQDWKPEPFKGQTIDIGVPEAKAWAMSEVERLVSDYHLDMLEHDGYLVAQGCDRTDHPHAPPDNWNKCIARAGSNYWVESSNSTDVSYHAVRAYYDIHSKLRQDHPGLLLEVCNDGGRMVDFGSAAHADYFSITDTYDPLSNRRAFHDTSYVLPAAMLESYVERWPTPRIENFRYMLRSGMMGWTTIMLDTSAWTPEQHTAAKEEFQLYKSQLRPFIRDADLYHVSARPDGTHWDGVQYFDPKRDQGVLYAFRGSTETESSHVFVLDGVRPEVEYKLQFRDHSSPDRTVKGAELLKKGFMVKLAVPNSSELVFIQGTEAK